MEKTGISKIYINNNKCKLDGGVPLLKKIRKDPRWTIRVEGAFFSPAYKKGRWDGKFYFISEFGIFDTGKLPQLIAMLKEWGESFKLIDERPLIRPKYKVNSLNGIIFRDYQREAVLAVGKSKINGLHFPICNISAATNAGKSIISAGIHAMYDSKTLFLINSKELLKE